MRWPVIPLLILGLLVKGSSAFTQVEVDLRQSVDPSTLTADELTHQIDTTNKFRRTVPLSMLTNEFNANAEVDVETYYQKSDAHLLLEMSKGTVPIDRTFLVSEGRGTTWWKISDGICWILLTQSSFVNEDDQLVIEERSCAE